MNDFRRFDTIQDLLQAMRDRVGTFSQLAEIIGVSRSALAHWLSTSDKNLRRFRSHLVERIVDTALQLGIDGESLPPEGRELLRLRERRVFLCHSKEDKKVVRDLHARLVASGLNPWLDEEDLRPGQDWRAEVVNAIQKSMAVLVCISGNSIEKTGFVQREIRIALDAAEERPEGSIFIIPVRVEQCTVPTRLKHLQWVDLFEPDGYDRLLKTLQEARSKSTDKTT